MEKYIFNNDRLYSTKKFIGRKEYNDWTTSYPWGDFVPKWMRGKSILVTGWKEVDGRMKIYGKEIDLVKKTRVSKTHEKVHLHMDTGMWTNIKYNEEYLEYEDFKIFIKEYSEYYDTPEENIEELRKEFEDKKADFLKEREEKNPKWKYSVSDLVTFKDGEMKLDFSMYPKGEVNIEYTSFIKKDSALD